MTVQAKRGRGGRPKGSKNKRTNLTRAHVRDICDYHKFNPAEKLIRIATNDDWDSEGKRINWPAGFQARATEKLFDGIHNNKAIQGLLESDSSAQQITLAFIESDTDFALPGAPSTEGTTTVLQSESIQRVGVSPPDGQDSICHQQTDT